MALLQVVRRLTVTGEEDLRRKKKENKKRKEKKEEKGWPAEWLMVVA